jgi:hypothetical protein
MGNRVETLLSVRIVLGSIIIVFVTTRSGYSVASYETEKRSTVENLRLKMGCNCNRECYYNAASVRKHLFGTSGTDSAIYLRASW